MTERVAATLALALVVLGCGPSADQLGDPVPLLTGVPIIAGGPGSSIKACFTFGVSGPFIVDPKYGTAMIVEHVSTPVVIAWRPGYTARQVGSEGRGAQS